MGREGFEVKARKSKRGKGWSMIACWQGPGERDYIQECYMRGDGGGEGEREANVSTKKLY